MMDFPLHIFTQKSDIGLWEWSLFDNRIECNSGLKELLHLDTDSMETTSHLFVPYLSLQEVSLLEKLLEGCKSGRQDHYQERFSLCFPNRPVQHVVEYGAVVERNPDGSAKRLAGLVFDITQEIIMEGPPSFFDASTRSPYNILRSTNLTAAKLLASFPETFEADMLDSMQIIGQSAQVERMYLWQNYEEKGVLHCRRLFLWATGEPHGTAGNHTIHACYDQVPYWKKELLQGRMINRYTRDLPVEERRVLEPHNALSSLIIPIFICGEFWGFSGFDNTRADRLFTEAEQNLLQSASTLLVSAVIRNDMTKNLSEAQDDLLIQEKLLRTVNDAAHLLIADEHENFPDTLRTVLQILGESVGSDRAYIWRNTLHEGELCCSQVMEWFKSIPSSHADVQPKNLPYNTYVPNWQDMLENLDSLNMTGAEFDKILANFPGLHDVQSCLILPIFLQGEFWGFIGFDSIYKIQSYTQTQENILRSGGMVTASAIVRNEMMENLIQAKEDALASIKAKNEFLSRMSHEMRTPMNAIIGMTNMAKRIEDTTEQTQQYLDKVESASQQLLSIINDVLDISSLDANELDVQLMPFDFDKMMQNILHGAQAMFEQKNQNLYVIYQDVFEQDLLGDEKKIAQVLGHLLSNANKFTPEEGTITLSIQKTPVDADSILLRIEVADTGIGISAQQREHVFQAFEQADGSITRQYGGTGLGLFLSKKTLALLQGQIHVQSEAGQGACFTIEVPVKEAQTRSHPDSGKALHSDLRILVVDKAEEVHNHFQNICGKWDLSCDIARSDAEGVACLSEKSHDLVFIDWEAICKENPAALHKIREVARDDIAVVMISAANWQKMEQDAYRDGVAQYLIKPVVPSVIKSTVVRFTNLAFRGEETAGTEDGAWKGKTILLAEDMEINREIVFGLLEETGLSIEPAENGLQAVEMYTKHPGKYSLILMDLQMPVLDGIRAARQIRSLELPAAQSVPIVAMTANVFNEDKQACLSAGMNDFVEKPLDVDLFFTVLSRYL